MDIRLLTSESDQAKYNAWVRSHPEGTLWQSLAWKKFQNALGKETRIYVVQDDEKIIASALVIIDRTQFGLSTWEIPRGPLFSGKLKVESEKLLTKIITDAKNERALCIYFSPLNQLSTFNSQLSTFHTQLSTRHTHPEATRILDLTLPEEKLLEHMKPKGRYNIRLAEKHGVCIQQSLDTAAYARLSKETATRDRFTTHNENYYKAFLQSLEGSFLLMASAGKETSSTPIAGLLGVIWNGKGIYYYGASSSEARSLMAPYLLQWHAMKHCRTEHCTQYDLFGIAPEGSTDHPWAGVTDFKAKFGGTYVTYPPEQEVILKPLMKKALEMKRRIVG